MSALSMSESQWSRADRAAAALQTYSLDTTGEIFGDEGSQEFDEAVMGLLVDLKHLLWRAAGPAYNLTELAESAAEEWARECEVLPVGGDDE